MTVVPQQAVPQKSNPPTSSPSQSKLPSSNSTSSHQGVSVQVQYTDPTNGKDCFTYVKSQGVNLSGHGNLTTYGAKLDLHNVPLTAARSGDVAIIRVDKGSLAADGHLAIVRNVTRNSDGTYSITIEEGGWGTCRISGCVDTRTSTASTLAEAEALLNITGIFQPPAKTPG
jgi:hypothetical protein